MEELNNRKKYIYIYYITSSCSVCVRSSNDTGSFDISNPYLIIESSSVLNVEELIENNEDVIISIKKIIIYRI